MISAATGSSKSVLGRYNKIIFTYSQFGNFAYYGVRIISQKTLRNFYRQKIYAHSEQAIRSWYAEVKYAVWESPGEIKLQYYNASILKDKRVVINIAGNKYRIVVKIHYNMHIVFIRFVGTHQQFDTIDPETI